MTVENKKKPECYGCSACVNSCPVGCLKLKQDSKGFFYPEIEKEECIECGKCMEVCPYNKELFSFSQEYYVGFNKNENERLLSSSGGIFSLIAKEIIKMGGFVFGAIFDENFNVIHYGTNSIDEIELFRGSKYVQSYLGEVYTEVKELLENNELVLFSGTPCQIAGLKSFLEKEYDNLYTCDLICMGVPSSKVWQEYLEDIKKTYKSKILKISFKNKSEGWLNPSICIEFSDGKILKETMRTNYYGKLFFGKSVLRDSCYSCQFATIKRVSDITIGDFWEVRKYREDLFDNKGISTILVNSDKGKEILSNISKNMLIEKVNKNDIMQPMLERPSKLPNIERR